MAKPIEGGYIVLLAYGEDLDWLKNVRASGRCTIEARDGTYTVGEAEIIDTGEALAAMSLRARLMFKALGHERCLKLTRLPEGPAKVV